MFFKRLFERQELIPMLCKACGHIVACHGSRGEILANGQPARNGCNSDVTTFPRVDGLVRIRAVECRCDMSRDEVVLNDLYDRRDAAQAAQDALKETVAVDADTSEVVAPPPMG